MTAQNRMAIEWYERRENRDKKERSWDVPVRELLIPVFTGMEGMDTVGSPAEGDWVYETDAGGASLVAFNQAVTTRKLHDYIYNGIMP